MHGLLGDVRLAFRRVAGSPGLTLLIVATFALGIGANTAVFSLFDQLILRSLPVKDPGRLVLIDTPGPNRGLFEANKNSPSPMSYPMFADLRDKTDAFEGVLAYLPTNVYFGVEGNTERVQADLVSGTYFDVLGLQPVRGRLFAKSDDVTPGAHPIVVLSHSFWTRRFAGDPGAVGKAVRINSSSMEIVGIAPPGFRGLEVGQEPAIFVPLAMKKAVTPTWDELSSRRAMFLTPVARLKSGLTLEQARERANVLYHQILAEEVKEIPTDDADWRDRFVKKNLVLLPGGAGASGFREQLETPTKVLLATAFLVLLIGCLNIANLLLTRATKRRKEIAVRLALGASRSRLVRELVVEGGVLAGLGLVAGLVVAFTFGRFLVETLPGETARQLLSFTLDLRVLAFATGLAVLGVVISTIAPAWQGTRVSLTPSLREGSGATSVGGQRTRNALVVGQIALSLSLLVGAGLLSRSLFNLTERSIGYTTEKIATFTINPALAGYPEDQKRALFERLSAEIAANPDVAAVGLTDNTLLANSASQSTIRVPGYEPKKGENMNPLFLNVSPGLFSMLQAGLAAGREFDFRDGAQAPKVAVVNEAFAKHFFKDGNAVGQRFGTRRGEDFPFEIVGVVKNFRQTSVNELDGRDQAFFPYAQQNVLGSMTFYVKGRGAAAPSADQMRAIVAKVDPSVPMTDYTTMEQQRQDSIFGERTMAHLASIFSALALLLAALGLYGVLSHGVTQRFREIGVRLAMGAGPRDIVRLILRQAGRLVATGLVVGVPVAAGLAWFVRSQLFGVPAFDPTAISAALLVLMGSAILAAYLPAARAARVDPSKTLRYE